MVDIIGQGEKEFPGGHAGAAEMAERQQTPGRRRGPAERELKNALRELDAARGQIISRQRLAELGELAAGAAHEIRNPLNLIQNFARTSASMMAELREALEAPPGPGRDALAAELMGEISENMGRIRRHCGRADRIAEDMLAMGRDTRGRRRAVRVNDLALEYAMLAYHSARSQDAGFNIRIVRELDPEAGEMNAVPEDIGRVVLNLVSNACHAAGERGQTQRGHQPTMWLSTRRDGDTVEIQVRDNGNGIPEETMGKIFNPFFTTRPTTGGTGLGLSLSSDIVREHGGVISAESEPGEYARFTVRLPANAQGNREEEEEEEEAP